MFEFFTSWLGDNLLPVGIGLGVTTLAAIAVAINRARKPGLQQAAPKARNQRLARIEEDADPAFSHRSDNPLPLPAPPHPPPPSGAAQMASYAAVAAAVAAADADIQQCNVDKPFNPDYVPAGSDQLQETDESAQPKHPAPRRKIQAMIERDADDSDVEIGEGDVMASIASRLPVPSTSSSDEHSFAAIKDKVARRNTIRTYDGLLAHQIPNTMVVGAQEIVEVRLGTEVEPQVLTLGIVGGGTLVMQNLPVVETMTIELYSTDSSFTIEPRSAADQLVHKKVLAGSPLQNIGSPYGRWVWAVTPQQTGDKTLALRVSAKVVDTLGNPTNETLVPDREFKISVRVNKKALAMGVGKWALITAPVAVVGVLFSEAIRVDGWPKMREQLIEAYSSLQVWLSQNL